MDQLPRSCSAFVARPRSSRQRAGDEQVADRIELPLAPPPRSPSRLGLVVTPISESEQVRSDGFRTAIQVGGMGAASAGALAAAVAWSTFGFRTDPQRGLSSLGSPPGMGEPPRLQAKPSGEAFRRLQARSRTLRLQAVVGRQALRTHEDGFGLGSGFRPYSRPILDLWSR